MKRIGIVFFFILGLGLLSSCGSDPATQSESADEKPACLFVMDGEDAKITPASDFEKTIELTIPLRGANHLVTWFTDRLVREAGHITMNQFARLWQRHGDDAFKNIPPNVAVSLNDKTLIATMTELQTVALDDGDEVLQTRMRLVRGEALSELQRKEHGLSAHVDRAAGDADIDELALESVSLFIDSIQAPNSDTSGHDDNQGQDQDETKDETTNS